MAKEESERRTGIDGVIDRAKESAKSDNIVAFMEYVAEHDGPKLNPVSVAIAVRGYKYFQASRRDDTGTAKKAAAKKAPAKKAAAKKTAKRVVKKSATKRVGRPKKSTESTASETPQADAEF